MLILQGRNTEIIVGRYKSIGDAPRIYSDAKRWFVEHPQGEQELVLLDNQKIVMTIESGRRAVI